MSELLIIITLNIMPPKYNKIPLDDEHVQEVFKAIIAQEKELISNPKSRYWSNAIKTTDAEQRMIASSISKRTGKTVTPTILSTFLDRLEIQLSDLSDQFADTESRYDF